MRPLKALALLATAATITACAGNPTRSRQDTPAPTETAATSSDPATVLPDSESGGGHGAQTTAVP